VGSTEQSALPLVRTANGGQRPSLLLVLSSQFAYFLLQVAIAFQHAPEGSVGSRTSGRLFAEAFTALVALLAGLYWSVAFHLLLQPQILVQQFLVAPLALLQVELLAQSRYFVLAVVFSGLVVEYTHDAYYYI
jgi:hypothetical protein